MLGQGVLVTHFKVIAEKTHNREKEEFVFEESFLKYPDRYEIDRYLKKEITWLVEYPAIKTFRW